MAAREGQGLQIAVIAFAFLAIVFAILTFVFYGKAQTAAKERAATLADNDRLTKDNRKNEYQIKAFKLMLGAPNVTEQDVEQAKGMAGGADKDVDEILTKFKSDMALIGDQAAPGEVQSYSTMTRNLLAALNRKNASVTDANEQARRMQAEKAAAENRDQVRVKTAEDSRDTAVRDLAGEQVKFGTFRTQIDDANKKLAEDLGVKDKTAKTVLDSVTRQRDESVAQTAKQQVTINSQAKQIKEMIDDTKLFENPDGKIVQVSQHQRRVWIDVGRVDGLLRQTTFNVYDHNENRVASDKAKAKIEVVQISGDHLAEARILEDTAANPIMPGDIIHTPTWSPGQHVHFALGGGKMDINHDRLDDYDLVRSVILLNGGVIDAELKPDGARTGTMSVSTRYFIRGEPPGEGATPKYLAEYSSMETERTRHGIELISVEKLLSMMGWRAEERTVELSGGRFTDFRRRTPGKTQPPAAAPPGTTPSTAPSETPLPKSGSDPFAAPAAADPFAAPTKPAADADPFAAPK